MISAVALRCSFISQARCKFIFNVFFLVASTTNPILVPEIRNRRILVAEDAVSSLKMMIRLLERAGHTCVGVENGREAVDAMKMDLDSKSTDPSHIPYDIVLVSFDTSGQSDYHSVFAFHRLIPCMVVL